MIAFASLSEFARNIALDRFRLLQPHLEEKRSLKAIARDGGIGYRTAQRWVMRYRKCGLAGLARNDRADRGRRRTITPALKEILEACSGNSAQSLAHSGRVTALDMLFTNAAGAKRWLSQWHKVPPPQKGQPVQPKQASLGLQIATSQTSEPNAA
jgi:transposase-like protein